MFNPVNPPPMSLRSRGGASLSHAAVARGVTLVELMVGMVIGLIAVLVISQVLLAAEGQKRATTSGSDAQLTGALALFTLQRDLEMTGYGLSASQIGLGCTIRALPFTTANGGSTRLLVPAQITPGAKTGDPDTVRILASSKQSFSVPTLVTNDHPKSGAVGVTEFAVNNIVGVAAGDLMIAVPPAPDATNTCTIFRSTGVGTTPGKSIAHASGGDPLAWNGSGSGSSQTVVSTLFPPAGYPATSYLINLGQSYIDRSYSVVKGNLVMTDFNRASSGTPTAVEIFPQVVNLRALYGKDTSATPDGSIDVYDDVQPTTADGWARVIAIRIAIVVRSNQYESDEVTTAEPEWDLGTAPAVTAAGAKNCGSGSGKCITLKVDGDLSAKDEWKHYRYKVYDTVIPLRNVVWRS
ncbi:PilW family protein [Piscinibacter sakaiensis]|uniref:PilW family protein n=1 Tax=Piscinibacter sakaiensis TaxID=1547922 RepID=UPI003AAEFC14